MNQKLITGLASLLLTSCGDPVYCKGELEFQSSCEGTTINVTYEDYGYDAATLKACVYKGNVGEPGSKVSEVIIYDSVTHCPDERLIGPKAQAEYNLATGLKQ